MAQVRQTIQGPEETPTAFLKRLKEAYRRYTPFDPEDPGQRGNVSMAFIWQSASDIRNKLQRLDNLQDYTLTDLLKEAEKFLIRERLQKKKKKDSESCRKIGRTE